MAHFYAYLGFEDLLLATLRLGTEIRVDDDGNSPFFYALDRGCQSCVDNLLQYLIELKGRDLELFLNYSYALRDDFQHLLNNSSVYLPEFLEELFYRLPNVTNFAVPKKRLPILHFSDNKKLNIYDFVYKQDLAPEGQNEIPIEFKTLPFPIFYITGSSGSIDLLKSISECPNSGILKTEFVKTFVREKWNELWIPILILTLLLWINLALMVCLLKDATPSSNVEDYSYKVLDHDSLPLAAAFLTVNGILFVYEMVQAFVSGIDYLTEKWNYIDLLRTILCFTWTTLSFYTTQDEIYGLTWTMVLLNFFRALSGFRAFDRTRFYLRLIFRAFNDAIAFIVIFFYSTFAFGILYYSSIQLHDFTVFDAWRSPYNMNMGSYEDPDSFNLQYVYSIFSSIINVIIMLNLLISILGDSFDSFQNESQEIDCLEMAELVIELEGLMFWRKNDLHRAYIQKCEDLESSAGSSWEGRLKAMMNAIDRSRKESNENFLRVNQKQDQILRKLNS